MVPTIFLTYHEKARTIESTCNNIHTNAQFPDVVWNYVDVPHVVPYIDHYQVSYTNWTWDIVYTKRIIRNSLFRIKHIIALKSWHFVIAYLWGHGVCSATKKDLQAPREDYSFLVYRFGPTGSK